MQMLWPNSTYEQEKAMHDKLFPLMEAHEAECVHSGAWLGGMHVEFEFKVPDDKQESFIGGLVGLGFVRDAKTVN
jgi:hypothetical protein